MNRVGAVAPQAELDPFAVDQDQAAVGRQRAVGDDQLQRDGFAAAGFAADEHVAFGQGDVDLAAQSRRCPGAPGPRSTAARRARVWGAMAITSFLF